MPRCRDHAHAVAGITLIMRRREHIGTWRCRPSGIRPTTVQDHRVGLRERSEKRSRPSTLPMAIPGGRPENIYEAALDAIIRAKFGCDHDISDWPRMRAGEPTPNT